MNAVNHKKMFGSANATLMIFNEEIMMMNGNDKK